MKTISRTSTNIIDKVFSHAKEYGKVYSLDNYFNGEPIRTIRIRELFEKTFTNSKLRRVSEMKFQVDCHSNLWYEFEIN